VNAHAGTDPLALSLLDIPCELNYPQRMPKLLKILLIFIALLAPGLLSYWIFFQPKPSLQRADIIHLEDNYSLKVQPIFDSKCVACHSCFNSPCQLNLTSFEGVSRGANLVNIYDFPKLKARKPTRLYTDAHSVEQWRELGFFPVTEGNQSLLSFMISQPKGIESGLQEKFDSEYSRVCIDSTKHRAVEKFLKANPAGRMPFGFPGLESDEISTIQSWLRDGAKGPSLSAMEERLREQPDLKPQIEEWEKFFNRKDLKSRIASRYLFEHLFLADVFFEDQPKIYFKLVRSRTHKGEIKEIGTDFPFAAIDGKFFYRLRPVTNTLVHKSNIPFSFSETKREEWEKDFFQSKWTPKEMPPYGNPGGNPFETFKDIPVESRYNLFLNNAHYFVMTFIKGPVCRGQTALNVINDHFWVLFLDPKRDPLVQSEKIYKQVAAQTQFPSEIGSSFSPLIDFRDNYWKSVRTKFDFLKGKPPLDLNALWNGDKKNLNATLTVFRHFDSAHVLNGLRGQTPKTVWVLDYHVFESIYYNLSAGYNVFGPLLHQLNSRLYMEVSRIASEDLFLSFLPQKDRLPLRGRWSQPTPKEKESVLKELADLISGDAKEKLSKEYSYEGSQIATAIKYESQNPKVEFLNLLAKKHYAKAQTEPRAEISHPLAHLRDLPAEIVSELPDTILVGVEDHSGLDVWTLIHNKDHFNVAMLLFEDERRNPAGDNLDIIQGVATSYVNLFIVLKKEGLKKFVEEFEALKGSGELAGFLKKYGVSRKDQNFWKVYQKFSSQTLNPVSNERGLLDLNRYSQSPL